MTVCKCPSVVCAGLETSHHVLEEGGVVFNAVLGLVDIKRGTNSYYKLQLLEGDTSKNYKLFRSWGRVGTTIGGNKLEVCLHSLLLSRMFPRSLPHSPVLTELWSVQGSCKGGFLSSVPGQDGEQLEGPRRHVH